jgi:hypothetical protein
MSLLRPWRPVAPPAINGCRYIDDGLRSGTNTDLAAEASEVVIIVHCRLAHRYPVDEPDTPRERGYCPPPRA